MEVQLGQFHLDIDIDKTRAFYEKIPKVSEGCNCSGCRNFEKAVEMLHDEVKCFFDFLGVNMAKPAEIYVNMANSDGLLLYGGFYHLCGTILSGESAWVEENVGNEDSIVSYWEHSNTYPVSEKFYVSFQNDCCLIEPGFPTPILQMEIEAKIPWVLQETNIYRR